MNAVSYYLAAAVVAAAVFAAAPHRGVAESTAQASPIASPSASADTSPAAATSAPVASPSPSAAATIDTKNFAYAPDSVTIKAGQTVRFTNSDSVAHTVSAADGSFTSGDMPTGSAWSHTFAKPGTYAYYCDYHRYMKGAVVVK